MSTIINKNTVLVRILIDPGTVFSEISALKSFKCRSSSFAEVPDTFDPTSSSPSYGRPAKRVSRGGGADEWMIFYIVGVPIIRVELVQLLAIG